MGDAHPRVSALLSSGPVVTPLAVTRAHKSSASGSAAGSPSWILTGSDPVMVGPGESQGVVDLTVRVSNQGFSLIFCSIRFLSI
jgi:hypothetical protein